MAMTITEMAAVKVLCGDDGDGDGVAGQRLAEPAVHGVGGVGDDGHGGGEAGGRMLDQGLRIE